MFTWICPQCGREVPPAYNDCPDCSKKTAAGRRPGAAAAHRLRRPVRRRRRRRTHRRRHRSSSLTTSNRHSRRRRKPSRTIRSTSYPQQPPQGPPPGYYAAPAPARGLNLPVWLMTILFAMAIAGVVFGILWMVSTNRGSAGNGPAPIASVESPAAKPGAKTNPLQKYIEVSGVRFVQDAKKKTMAKFVLINHSEADINGLAGNVTIWGRTQKSEEDAQGTFSFSTNLAPYGIQGTVGAAEYQAQDLRIGGLAEPHHRRADHRTRRRSVGQSSRTVLLTAASAAVSPDSPWLR